MNIHSLVFSKIILLLVFPGVLFFQNANSHTDLTVVSWGGALARAHMQAWIIPWENNNNKAADLVYYGGGIAKIRDQVETTNVIWDVVDMEYSDLIQACDAGLLEKIDHGSFLNSPEDFIDGALANECGIGAYVWATVYAYDKGAFKGSAPSSIADFFDIQKFPGNRGLRQDPRGTLEWALMAAGVPSSEVYAKLATEEGLNMAFEELDKIKPFIVWWTGGSEPAALLDGGEVTMSAAWNGRLFRSMMEQKVPIDIVWDGQIWQIEYLAIPKGSPNLVNAQQFIRYASSTEGLAGIAKYIPYGPVRKSAQTRVTAEIKPHLPTQNISATSLRFNSPWWAENIDRIRARFDWWMIPSSVDIEGRGARF